MLDKLKQIFTPAPDRREQALALYTAVVGEARQPHWYEEGGVPDSIDGRFDMLSSIIALTLIRMQKDGGDHDEESVALTELFIDDMDGSLRQAGIGDLMVGKHMGRLMGALGGRMEAYGEAVAANDGNALSEAVTRNIFRGEEMPAGSLNHVSVGLRAFHDRLAKQDRASLLRGEFGW